MLWALTAFFLGAILLGGLAFTSWRRRRAMYSMWRAESTVAPFQGSLSGSQALRPTGPPRPLNWPLYEPRRGDTVSAPGEIYHMAVWCEAEDPNFVFCVPLIPNAKTGEDEGKLLFRRHAKRSLTFWKHDVTFTYFS